MRFPVARWAIMGFGLTGMLAAQSSRPAASEPFDLTRLIARQDSFDILLAGAHFGWQRTSLEPTTTGYVYRESLEVGEFASTRTEVELDRQAGMRHVRQSGRIAGRALAVELTFWAGRVHGVAEPSATGMGPATIDAAFEDGALDSSALPALLPALSWGPDASWTFRVFNVAEGAHQPWILRVVGRDSVQVGDRYFQAYRAELTAEGTTAYSYWVSVDLPYRILKITLAGQPLEIVRVR